MALRHFFRVAITLPVALGLAACSTFMSGHEPSADVLPAHTVGQIKHVVFIVQEGRTFENLFAGWPGAFAPMTAREHDGKIVPLQSLTYADDRLITAEFEPARIAYDGGKLDGFDINTFGMTPSPHQVGRSALTYLVRKDAAPYAWLASHYVLADHMFPTEWGGSFTGHLGLIAGSTFINSNTAVADFPTHTPWGCDAPAGTLVPVEQYGLVLKRSFWVRPCFDQFPTLADLLDRANISWKYYISSPRYDPSGLTWSAFDSIKNVRYGADWKTKVVSPVTTVIHDASNGTLPAVSWVIPKKAWSDDPSETSDQGPSWVADTVNAIGKSPEWSSTAIVIVWSHWGGWYDPGPPNQIPQLLQSGFAIRVPCIIVSPYAKKGFVSHTVYGFGSLLRFVEETFRLPALSSVGKGYVFTDDTSASISDSLDLRQTPKPFETVPAKYPIQHFLK